MGIKSDLCGGMVSCDINKGNYINNINNVFIALQL